MAGHRKTLAIRGAQIENYIRFVERLSDPDMIGRKDAARVVCSEFGVVYVENHNNNRQAVGAVVGGSVQEGMARTRARYESVSLRGEGAGRIPEFDPDRIARRAARLEHEKAYVAAKSRAGRDAAAEVRRDAGAVGEKVARQRSGGAVDVTGMDRCHRGGGLGVADDCGKDVREVCVSGAEE